ncbi:nucleolar protein 6-like [Watersipora subatra]|uniref:nucleolar protein 6-like n=1 Tax=Watersipora subatra TaxID=2589382 RepID=UPI00355BC267
MYTGDDASALLSRGVDDMDQNYAYNVTNFKVTALLAEATYTASQVSAIQAAFSKLKSVLIRASHVPSDDLKVKIPTCKHSKREKIISESSFLPPSKVHLCGSFVSGLALSSAMTVDVRVIVPKSFYRVKDFLNQIWLVRKSFYVAVLAHHLQKKANYQVSYMSPHNNPLDIGLQVKCKDSVVFNILLVGEEGVFAAKRLAPLASNVRAAHVNLASDPSEDEVHTPTPLYNNTLATNQIAGGGEQLTADWVNESTVVKECMVLTRIWMHQRDLDMGFDCVSPFIVRMLMIYLLKNRKLAYHTTSHQMFLSFLQKIASFDWSKPICMKEVIEPETLANHMQVSQYVFLDPTGIVNYCAAVSSQAMEMLKHHANSTVTLMMKDTDSSFHDTFIKKLPAHLYYDYGIKLYSVSKWTCIDRERYIDSCGDAVYSALPKVLQVLKRGLGKRITSLVTSPLIRHSSLVKIPSKCTRIINDSIIIRFSIDLDLAFNTLERGPPADDPLAEEFRQFWGEQSNLRRFMDGAICEAVVWDAELTSSKRKILGFIAELVLERHCKISNKTLAFGCRPLENLIMCDSFRSKRNCGSGEEEAAKCQAALFQLSKQIRAIPSLPLSVTDIVGLDPASRDTQVFPSMTGANIPTLSPTRVLCIVEGSKWPDHEDTEATATLKMLMLLKMNEALNSLDSVTSFVRDGGLTIFQESLQVNLSLMNAAELARLRHKADFVPSRKQFIDYVVLPHVTMTLAGLQSQHSTFGATCRLFKRWLGIHLLSTFLPEPCTDLIAASLFVNPAPFEVPRCPNVGFQRCLHFLVHHDWVNEPLILNFNEEIVEEKLEEFSEEFKARRAQFPCLCIVTPTDHGSLVSRSVMPFMFKLVLDHASRCLRNTEECFANVTHNNEIIETEMFKMDQTKTDILIKLLPECSRRISVKLKQENKIVEVYTDPALNYIKHIEKAYGDKVVVMYDINCIKFIGLIWKPGAHNPQPLKQSKGAELDSSTLCDVDDELWFKLNTQAMLQDLNIVGKGIISEISVNSAE